MSVGRGENEGVRMVGDFTCEAIPVTAPPPPQPENRQTELRRLGTAALLALVRAKGSELPPGELCFIHDLAIERLARNGTSAPGAAELSREAMRIAAARIA